jgi:septal ring factor EnvC (AmiA/AmiB activator)
MEQDLMSDAKPNYHNHFYTALLLLGLIICFVDVNVANSRIDYFESNSNRIHRLITNVEIDLDTLEKEAVSIERTMQDLHDSIKPESKKNTHSENELKLLQQNILKLRGDIAEKQKLTITLNLIKSDNITQMKTYFWIITIAMVIGLLMVISGAVSLAVKLEILQDRRRKSRKEESTDAGK